MPWISLLIFLATFLISKKKGASTGTAALAATAAGVGTYMLADPANPDNVFGVGQGVDVTDAEAGSPTLVTTTSGTAGTSTWGAVTKTALETTKDVVTNPNTAGTVAAVGATTGSGIFQSKNMPWLIGGLALILLMR